MSITDRIHFGMMSVIHEDLYRLLRDPYEVLDAAGLKQGQDVLEVGPGPGFFTVPAARIVGEEGSVHAADINPLALEKIREKLDREGVTNVVPVLADATRTGLPARSFDLIFVFGLGHAVGDVDEIMTELDRLLRPTGVLSIEGRLKPPSHLFEAVANEGRIVRYRKAA
jgi:ubiquinone/menaquinone biosynthesis C-methylase UbiE